MWHLHKRILDFCFSIIGFVIKDHLNSWIGLCQQCQRNEKHAWLEYRDSYHLITLLLCLHNIMQLTHLPGYLVILCHYIDIMLPIEFSRMCKEFKRIYTVNLLKVHSLTNYSVNKLGAQYKSYPLKHFWQRLTFIWSKSTTGVLFVMELNMLTSWIMDISQNFSWKIHIYLTWITIIFISLYPTTFRN